MRTGCPKLNSPSSITARPFTWPTRAPPVAITSVSCSTASCSVSRRRSARRMRAASACSTSCRPIAPRPARWAIRSASCRSSSSRRVAVDSLPASPAVRAACSTRRATAPRSSGRSPAARARVARQPREPRGVVRVARHVVLEVRRDLEQLVEIGVEVLQQVIVHALAEQHDLQRQRDRLRLQRQVADQAHQLRQRFDRDLARLERALQAIPGDRAGPAPAAHRASGSRRWPGAARPA